MNKFLIIIFCTLPLQSPALAFFSSNPSSSIKSTNQSAIKETMAITIKNKVTKLYENKFNGKKLDINFIWDDGNVNAYATRDFDDNPIIKITGGMINNKNLSPDGLALIVCHELGHFLGGAPKKFRGRSRKRSWSSAEGQADYFATAKCLKSLFPILDDFSKKKFFQNELAWQVDQICKKEICKRIAFASYSVALVYAKTNSYEQHLNLLTPMQSEVYRTIFDHPDPQCRLDTMIAGTRCVDSLKINFQSKDENKNNCKQTEFARPRCWYAPRF